MRFDNKAAVCAAALALFVLAGCATEVARREERRVEPAPAGRITGPEPRRPALPRQEARDEGPNYAAVDPTKGPMLHVSEISYRDAGGAVWVEIEVEDQNGKAVEGVEIGVSILRRGKNDGSSYVLGTDELTDATGVVSYKGPEGTGPATYRTKLLWVLKRGVFHDPTRDAGDPGYIQD